MNCSQCQSWFDDYIDGELDGERRQAVDRHVEHCRNCRGELESLQSLLDSASRLTPEVSPERDLWPAIEARIQPQTATAGFGWLQWAAAVIALVVLSIPLTVWWQGREASENRLAIAPAGAEERFAGQALLARSEDGVQLPRTDLITAIERHRDVVEASTMSVFEENMHLLDQAIGELRAALAEDPQNLHLRMLLAARYQQERKLLQRVNRV